MKKQSKVQGYILIDPITGRKFWTGDRTSHKVDKLAQNFPIQGEAGGITKYAAILFRRWILMNKLQDVVFITNLVHDEVNVEVLEGYAGIAAKGLESAMNKAAEKWCKIVPLTAGAAIVDYWTH